MTASRDSRRNPHSILGTHPVHPHPFAEFLLANDGFTLAKVPHRTLSEADGARDTALPALREMIVRHHADTDALARDARRRSALEKLGFADELKALARFPRNESTRKGNLAEVVLAEYIVAARALTLPVYRLRYNPNVDQSMKGDDVLAFDLTSQPRRIVVGEAKYREIATKTVVAEIIEALTRSHKSGLPVSLQFVADRLFEAGADKLGFEVADCARLFAVDELVVEYIGLLFGDENAHSRIHSGTSAAMPRLAMLSVGVVEPNGLVLACYQNLE